MQVSYALYTDSGQLYLGDDKKSLMTAVAEHANLADCTNAREIAAADYAATGNLATARVRMVNALPNASSWPCPPPRSRRPATNAGPRVKARGVR